MSYPAHRARSCADIERLAAGVRTALKLKCSEPLHGRKLFESLGGYKVEFQGREIPLSYHVEELEPTVEAEARYLPDSGEIEVCLSLPTYLSLVDEVPRARFSLFHEIGHAVMHPGELTQLSRIDRRRAALMRGALPPVPAYRDAEWQANYFAAALAVPARGLDDLRSEGCLNEASVKSIFRVSGPCARRRIRDFERRRGVLLRAVAPS